MTLMTLNTLTLNPGDAQTNPNNPNPGDAQTINTIIILTQVMLLVTPMNIIILMKQATLISLIM
jgi:hypothetical protein